MNKHVDLNDSLGILIDAMQAGMESSEPMFDGYMAFADDGTVHACAIACALVDNSIKDGTKELPEFNKPELMIGEYLGINPDVFSQIVGLKCDGCGGVIREHQLFNAIVLLNDDRHATRSEIIQALRGVQDITAKPLLYSTKTCAYQRVTNL